MSEFRATCALDDDDSITVEPAYRGHVGIFVFYRGTNAIVCLSPEDSHRLTDYLVEAGFGSKAPVAEPVPAALASLEARVSALESDVTAVTTEERLRSIEADIADLSTRMCRTSKALLGDA